jgi:hypothetical protein
MREKLRVGVIGAGRWAGMAHLPGFSRSPLCELVAICDVDRAKAEARAAEFGIPDVNTDYQEILRRDDIDVVDIVTSGDNHHELSFATLEAGKHCLVEKPVCHDYADTWRAHQLAESKNLKTKVGLTFRYAPAMQYMYELVQQSFIGRPFIFNGYEQNSQFIDAAKPMRFATDTGDAPIRVSSLEGYGAPIIDISLWMVESEISSVAGILKNFIPQRRRRVGAPQYRRRRHVYLRVRQRRDRLDPVELCNRRQLPRHRGAAVWREGRADLPAGRGVWRVPDAALRHARRRRVCADGDPGALLPARRAARRALERAVLRQPGA